MKELQAGAATRLQQIVGLIDQVNVVGRRLTANSRPVFAPVSLKTPKLIPSELGYLKVVSWLYATFQEAGGASVKFLLKQLAKLSLDPGGTAATHLQMVHHMRTFLQHNLRKESANDQKIMQYCGACFQRWCGTEEPDSEEEWGLCLQSLLDEAAMFLNSLKECLDHISGDESLDIICHDWEFQVSRSHAPHEFENLIQQVATDIGQEAVDIAAFCKRHHSVWNATLQNLTGDYRFEVEARKLIEHDLLHEWSSSLPITGEDVIMHFELEPGPEVGRLLRRARVLYDEERCNKPTLLMRLEAELEN